MKKMIGIGLVLLVFVPIAFFLLPKKTDKKSPEVLNPIDLNQFDLQHKSLSTPS